MPLTAGQSLSFYEIRMLQQMGDGE